MDYENKHAFTRQLAAPSGEQHQAFQMCSVQNQLFDAQFQPNLACEYPNSCTYNTHTLTVHTKKHTEAKVEGLSTYIYIICGQV